MKGRGGSGILTFPNCSAGLQCLWSWELELGIKMVADRFLELVTCIIGADCSFTTNVKS